MYICVYIASYTTCIYVCIDRFLYNTSRIDYIKILVYILYSNSKIYKHDL